VTTPVLYVGVGFFRPTVAGEDQPPGFYAEKEPFSTSGVISQFLAPSGSVPGGMVLGYAVLQRCGDNGARPDGFSNVIFRVLYAKCLDLIVISLFLVPLCTCICHR
jgi:hypothetical protein